MSGPLMIIATADEDGGVSMSRGVTIHVQDVSCCMECPALDSASCSLGDDVTILDIRLMPPSCPLRSRSILLRAVMTETTPPTRRIPDGR